MKDMMPAHLVPSFLFYCFVQSITPGPANICSLTVAMQRGRKDALWQWTGIFVGFTVDALAAVFAAYFLGVALRRYVPVFSVVGAAYLVFLAIRQFMRAARGTEQGTDATVPYRGFTSGLLVQLTNVKVILYCFTALTTYAVPYGDSLWDVLKVGLFLPFTGPVCNLAWLFLGASLHQFFTRHSRALCIAMGLALLACAAMVLC